ncbi:hypothetical protein EJD97_018113, partial [Solanum chilense]
YTLLQNGVDLEKCNLRKKSNITCYPCQISWWFYPLSGSNVGSSWRISSIFGGSDNRPFIEDNFICKQFSDPELR